MSDFNPDLQSYAETGSDKGGAEGIEVADRVRNIAWQTRPALPTAEEDALGDALQMIFGEEIYELPKIIERLNQLKIKPPAGAALWSEENFRAEFRRLGV